jgi:hypothetical protein
VYAAGGLNAFVCNTTFLGLDQFFFWKSCMGSHADSHVVPDAKLAAGGFPVIGSGKNPTSKCAGQPPGPGALWINIDGPAPPSGPGTPAHTSVLALKFMA